MKLNLQCGYDVRNGYRNITSVPIDLSDEGTKNCDIVLGDFKKLDPIVEDGIVSEIIFNPPLNVLAPPEIPDVLSHWKNKMTEDGILKLHAVDIRRVGRSAHNGEINLQDIHTMTLGQNYEYRSVIDTNTLKELISKLGFTILLASIVDYIVIIEAKKNA